MAVAVGDSRWADGCDTAKIVRVRRRVREGVAVHQLMRELLTLVPADDAPWPAEARARWMAAFAAVADVVYEDGHLFETPRPLPVDGAAAVDGAALDVTALEHGRATVDLRAAGSGNPGGLNAARVLGKKWGLLVIVMDAAKGALAGLAGLAMGDAAAENAVAH